MLMLMLMLMLLMLCIFDVPIPPPVFVKANTTNTTMCYSDHLHNKLTVSISVFHIFHELLTSRWRSHPDILCSPRQSSRRVKDKHGGNVSPIILFANFTIIIISSFCSYFGETLCRLQWDCDFFHSVDTSCLVF